MVSFVHRIYWRRNKGPTDWRAEHTPYITLWNTRGSSRQYYLHGPRHSRGPWVEYLRWLQLQSCLFLRLAYTDADIAELPDFDGDNEIVDEYDKLTRHGTVQPECGPLQNYVVNFFPHFYYLRFLKVKFLIVSNVVQATQLGWFANEATDALSHLPNSAVSHNVLRAFAEVSMVSISLLHPNEMLNSLYYHSFLCRGSARVIDGWHFTATASEPSMCVIGFRPPGKGHVQIVTPSDNDEGTDVDAYLNTAMFST
jgi:hypothetical protein